MSENDDRPRLMTKQQAAAYCGVSGPTFTKWVLAGDMPGPFRSTRMYDRRAIDLVLDKAAGISHGAPPKEDALDKWLREKAEREVRKESAFDKWEREEAEKAASSKHDAPPGGFSRLGGNQPREMVPRKSGEEGTES